MMLLDTHVLLNLSAGTPIRFADEYANADLALSPVTAGEIACLQRLGRIRLTEAADRWFEAAVERLGAKVLPLTPGTFARAMALEWEHKDPADRILVQTTQDNPGVELHTRDGQILRYAAASRLNVRDCRI
jgi:PIN domain nuclease of toxin-antitoxin system